MFLKRISSIFSYLNTTRRLSVVLFLFSFILNYFLTQGVPFFMYGHDDFSNAWLSETNSWSHLFHVLFTERLQAGDNVNYQLTPGFRATYYLAFKAILFVDGMHSPAFHLLVNIIVFSTSAVFLFLILDSFSINKVFSFFGAVLYITSVSTYSLVYFVGEPTLFYHLFMLVCFYLFLTKYLLQEKTNPFILSILIFVFTLLAIKSKQIAVIVPITLFLYCVCVKQNVHGVLKRRIPLFSIALLYYLPNFFESSVHRTVRDLFLSFKTYYIYNPWIKIGDGEQIPALFSPFVSYNTAAGSLMGIYKFLFGWLFIILSIFFLISIYHSFKEKKRIENWNSFSFILLWHFLEIAVMTFYFETHLFEGLRYIGIAVPSFIVFTFYSMQKGFDFISSKDFMYISKRGLYALFVVFVMLSIVSNVYVSAIQLRGGLLSRHTLIHDSIYVAYKDYFKEENIDDNIFFSVFHVINYTGSREKEKKLEEIFYADIYGEFGSGSSTSDTQAIKKKIEERSFVYVTTFKSEVPFKNKILLAKLSACPPESSIYCYL